MAMASASSSLPLLPLPPSHPLFPSIFVPFHLCASRIPILRAPPRLPTNKVTASVWCVRWNQNGQGAVGAARFEGRRERTCEFEGPIADCSRTTDGAFPCGSRVPPILVKCLVFILHQSRFRAAVVLHAPAWCRSSAVVVGLFLFLSVRAAAAVQNPVLPKPSPVVSRLPTCSATTGASSASAVVENLNAVDSLLQRECLNEQGGARENTECTDAKVAAAEATENTTTTSSQGSMSRIDSSDERGRGAEPMDECDLEFEEDYEEKNDDMDELDETFADIEADWRIQRALPNKSEPRRKAKGEDTNTVSEGVGTEIMGSKSKSEVEKEMEEAFEEWRASPYKLTVPLRVVGLRGSVPAIWLKDFILSQGRKAKTKIEYQGSLRDIVSALATSLHKKQIKPRSIIAADVVTVGDSWLRLAVSGGLIEPIKDAEDHDWFKRLGPRWQALLRRDEEGYPESQGLVWGAPYRWGSMVIAYRKDKLALVNVSDIKDWKDLWKPELSGKIAMVDSPREVVGAVLKSLGASYNTKDFDKDVHGGMEAVKQQFLALQKQVRLFDSVMYLKALSSGDVWVAVGWSNDVIPVAKRMSNISVVVPASGVSLWADLWAIPAATSIPSDKIGARAHGASPLVHQWFDFCLQPARDLPFKQGVFAGASPLHVCEDGNQADDQKELTTTSEVSSPNEARGWTSSKGFSVQGPKFDTNLVAGMPPEDILAKSEFLEPLSKKAIQDFEYLLLKATGHEYRPSGIWQIIRQAFHGGFAHRGQRQG